VIRFSALLVALAIGLLVAGVVASSLLMVYVSIAVCAVAALLLAAGVLWHWSEIFGGGAAQPASSAVSGPAPAATPVPASPVPAGTASASTVSASTGADSSGTGSPAGSPARGRGEAEPVGAGYGASGPGAAAPGQGADPAARRGRGRGEGADEPGSPGPAARPPDRSRRDDRRPGRKDPSGRPSRRPAEPAPPQVEQPVASRPDDLWERVNEELESAGKRDTGALTWPATEFTAIPPVNDEPAPSGGQPPGLGPAVGEDLWQPAAGWQPPANPQLRWPTLLPPTEPGAPGAGGPPDDEPGVSEPAAGEPETATEARTLGEPDDRAPDGSEAEPDAGRADEPADSGAGAAGDREIRASPAGELQFSDLGASDLGASDLRARESSAVAEDGPPEDAATKDAPAQDAAAGDAPARDAAGTGAAAGTAGATHEDEDRAGDEAAPAPDGAAAEHDAAGDSAPPWTIASWRAGQGLADGKPAAAADEDAAAADEGAMSADEAAVDEAAAPEPGKKPNPAEGWLTAGPTAAAAGPGTQDDGPAGAGQAPGSAGGQADRPARPTGTVPVAGTVTQAARPQSTGQIEVTVVPGVARYHRSGCILIRFLGTDDLAVMPRQQAQDAGFVACRACQPDELKPG
jgi:hypothetical protein